MLKKAKYVATLPCNLSLMAFADINFSQGSVATYARCCGMFIIHLTANFLRNLSVRKKFVNRLRFDRIMVMSLWPRFLALPVDITVEKISSIFSLIRMRWLLLARECGQSKLSTNKILQFLTSRV